MAVTQHRGVVVAKKGIVAASQPLAVSAGLSVLQAGGSFADAAIALSAVLCVTEPGASHVGGDAFVIVYDAKTGNTTAFNGSGAAPLAATPKRFANSIPLRGMSAATVPGLVAVWQDLHDRYGTRPLTELLAPAIDYAENGYPLSYRVSRAFANAPFLARQFPHSYQALTGGTVPNPAAVLRQPDLAWTLRQIAEGGREAFYNGPITERLLAHSQANGGLFAAEDFALHQTQISEPIRTTYRDYTIHGQPPVTQGHILLQELNLLEGFDLASLGHNSPDTIHLQVEAKKLAFADRAAYLGDPRFVSVPIDTLLSKAYAGTRRQAIDLDHANSSATEGEIHHDTTYFCLADSEGNAVSFIQSVFWGFGSGEVAVGTGVLFNNRLTGFSLKPSHPNVLAPGKRPAHTLNAYVVTRDEKAEDERQKIEENRGSETQAEPSSLLPVFPFSRLAFVGGTPGADIQVQSNLQVICNVIDFGMNPQEAIEAARWQHGESVGGTEPQLANVLAVEERIEPETRDELTRRGHLVEAIGPWAHASSYQLIAVAQESGAYLAGSDPRCDGHAAGC